MLYFINITYFKSSSHITNLFPLHMIILFLLLLFLLFYLSFISYSISSHLSHPSHPSSISSSTSSSIDIKSLARSDIIQRITTILRHISTQLYTIPIHIPFSIINSNDSTWVENKHVIHLRIWNFDDDKPFPFNTLLFASIHELSHIICPDIDHTPLFNHIESHLLSIASSLGYYNPHLSIHPSYPCMDSLS